MNCNICNDSHLKAINVKDNMYGKSDVFKYIECASCGCLQIESVPLNLASYYPENYYSFTKRKRSFFSTLKRRFKFRLIFSGIDLLMPLVKLITKNYKIFWIYKKIGIRKNWKILDVGAGSGAHVADLLEAGFANSIGIDPYIQDDIFIKEKLLVKKTSLDISLGTFNLIVFHHSYEHMIDQYDVLERAHRCLTPDGILLLRIPTVSSSAYSEFGEFWYQLDAPRHLYLHSHKSIEFVAKRTGFDLIDLWSDANELQFLISHQYKNFIFGNNELSYLKNKKNIKNDPLYSFYKIKTSEANKKNLGDQIVVILKKSVQ